jgi:hypothetical protein
MMRHFACPRRSSSRHRPREGGLEAQHLDDEAFRLSPSLIRRRDSAPAAVTYPTPTVSVFACPRYSSSRHRPREGGLDAQHLDDEAFRLSPSLIRRRGSAPAAVTYPTPTVSVFACPRYSSSRHRPREGGLDAQHLDDEAFRLSPSLIDGPPVLQTRYPPAPTPKPAVTRFQGLRGYRLARVS